jgi:hypothetical protein
MKRTAMRSAIIISLIFSASTPVIATAKEPILTVDIGESRKLLYGETETFISCWSSTKGTIYLDVKVNGKWKQKAKSSLRRDAKYCSDKEYPGASKLKWTPDELSKIKGIGRTYTLEVRERYGSIVKPESVSTFTIPIYRSSSDLINDLVDQLPTTPTQTQPVLPTRTPTPVSVPTPTYTPIPVPTYTRTPTPTYTPTPTPTPTYTPTPTPTKTLRTFTITANRRANCADQNINSTLTSASLIAMPTGGTGSAKYIYKPGMLTRGSHGAEVSAGVREYWVKATFESPFVYQRSESWYADVQITCSYYQ